MMKELFIALSQALTAWLFDRAGERKVAQDRDGWIRLRPGIVLTAFNVLLLALGVFGAFCAVNIVTRYLDGANQSWAALLLPPVLTAASVAWLTAIYATRYRFNAKGIEHRFFHRANFVRWTDVAEINSSEDMFGWIRLKSGRAYTITKSLRGFAQMIAAARQHGVKINK